MPVTKTAKRALRGSLRKKTVNSQIISKLEILLRLAKKSGKAKDISNVFSLADRAAKKNVIHKNKAARIKSSASKLLNKNKVQIKSLVKTKKASKSVKI